MGAYLAIKSRNIVDIPNATMTMNIGAYYKNYTTGYKLEPNKTYTLSWNYEFVSTSTVRVYVSIGSGTYKGGYNRDLATNIDYPNKTSGKMVATLTTPANLLESSTTGNAFLGVRFIRVDNSAEYHEIKISNVMFVEGSYTADTMPDYEPYYLYKKVKALTVSSNKFEINGGYTRNSSQISIDGDKIINKSVAGGYYEMINYTKSYPAGTYRICVSVDTTDNNKSCRFLIRTNTAISGMSYLEYYGGYWKTLASGEPFTFTASEEFTIGYVFGVSTVGTAKTYYDISLKNLAQRCTIRMRPTASSEAYQRVEYIESTGTQYIDTGFAPNQDTRLQMDFEPTTLSTSNDFFFGSMSSENERYYACKGGNSCFWVAYASTTTNSALPVEPNTKYSIDMDKNNFYVDGALRYESTYSAFNCSATISLFGRRNSDTTVSTCAGKLYSCKIYDNGKLIRNYVPCYRRSDGAVGLLDIVSGVFFTNQGTGTFIKGENL